MKTTQKTTNATKPEATSKARFDLLRAEYEKQAQNRNPKNPATEKAYTEALTALATAAVYSVLKKCINATDSGKAQSYHDCKPTAHNALTSLKRSVAIDTNALRQTAYLANSAHATEYNADGDSVQVCLDEAEAEALDKFCAEALGQGIDLVQEASFAILNETAKQVERGEEIDLEKPYTVRRLKRKVYIQSPDSVGGWETVSITPIQEVYRAVRRLIESYKPVRVDTTSAYCYIDDTKTDSVTGETERVYRRLPKYSDFGNYATDSNGAQTLYTVSESMVSDIDSIAEKLNLTTRQALILKLRYSDRYGHKAIATYLGVSRDSVRDSVKAIQRKAEKNGLTIEKYNAMQEKIDAQNATQKIDIATDTSADQVITYIDRLCGIVEKDYSKCYKEPTEAK